MKKAIKQMNGKEIGDRAMRIKKAVEKERLQKKFKNIQKKKVKAGRMMKEKYRNKFDKNQNNNNHKKKDKDRSMKFKNEKQNNVKKWKTKSIKKQ